jgi:hypothetical protein
MEVEFITCFKATNHALWLQDFILGLGIIDLIKVVNFILLQLK